MLIFAEKASDGAIAVSLATEVLFGISQNASRGQTDALLD